MSSDPIRVYWDACTWISYISREMPGPSKSFTERRFDMCSETLKAAVRGDIEIVTSAFTLAEVCNRSIGPTSPAIHLPSFFDNSYILLVPVDKVIGIKAQHLQSANISKIKPPDAVHLASALCHSIGTFHTFDKDLLRLNNLLTLENGNTLRICKPTEENPGPPLLEVMRNH